ncbi:MAG: PorP/SprF family type IX secretion system membrane protein [Paludibacter sp.]|nr:PorP/SprF family type IX secretion system membrane protein [Paludibacter sp.]
MIKKVLLILIWLLEAYYVNAQSNIRLNNYWGSMNSVTPAWIYDRYQAVFSMAARKQWAGLTGAPATLYASASTYVDDINAQFGMSVLQDKIGYTTFSNFNLSYGFVANINYDWQLHLGVAGDYQYAGYDLSQVYTGAEYIDPVLGSKLQAKHEFNADFGIEISNLNFKLGFASQNIFELFTTDTKLQTPTQFLYIQYRRFDNYLFNYGFGICEIEYAGIYQGEFNATGYFKSPSDFGLINKPDLFDLGIFYRTGSQAGLILGFNISDVFHVSYSYDYHFSGLGFGTYGTNEIMLTYNLRFKPMCHNCWY